MRTRRAGRVARGFCCIMLGDIGDNCIEAYFVEKCRSAPNGMAFELAEVRGIAHLAARRMHQETKSIWRASKKM